MLQEIRYLSFALMETTHRPSHYTVIIMNALLILLEEMHIGTAFYLSCHVFTYLVSEINLEKRKYLSFMI